MDWRRGHSSSQDLRGRVLAAEGSARAVASRFGVSVSYVVKAWQRRDRTRNIAAGPQRSHTPRRLGGLHDTIFTHVQQHQDATLDELPAWLREAHGVSVSMGLMWNTLARLGLTLKKTQHAAGQTRADIADARRQWCELQPKLNPARLVFLDG